MREMEPDSAKPYEVEDREYRIGKCVLNPGKAVSRIVSHADAGKLGKHHVTPEIVKVQEKAYKNDKTKNEHVLRCQRHLRTTVGDSITLVTARTPVLGSKNKGIHDMAHSKERQAESTKNSIPIRT